MRTARLRALLVPLGPIAGCGDSVSPTPAVIAQGPHGGVARRLPGDAGFVEIVNDPEVDRGARAPTAIVAYFLLPDGTTPLSPLPSGVAFTPAGRGASAAVKLEPSPKADDPTGAGRFASKAGPYQLEALRGTLAGKVGGQDFGIELAGGER